MTGAEWAAIASILGPTLGGLFGSDPQERKSFAGTKVAPLKMMEQANDFTKNLSNALSGRIAQGVNLPSAVAQTPGAYTGGGLPMPIGVSAQDPALSNQSLLSLRGLSGFDSLLKPSDGSSYDDPIIDPGQTQTGIGPQDGFDPDTGLPLEGFDNFYLPNFSPNTDQNPQGTTDGYEPGERGNSAESRRSGVTGPVRRSALGANDGEYGELVRAGDLGGGEDADLNQALGSVQLLLEAFGGGRGATA